MIHQLWLFIIWLHCLFDYNRHHNPYAMWKLNLLPIIIKCKLFTKTQMFLFYSIFRMFIFREGHITKILHVLIIQ